MINPGDPLLQQVVALLQQPDAVLQRPLPCGPRSLRSTSQQVDTMSVAFILFCAEARCRF